jgi:hypothetical protein
MSSDYLFECAKNFEELYSKTNERLELIKSKGNIKDDLIQIKQYITEMENLLNSIELESSLMGNKDLSTNEFNISQSCRSHFNEIRKKFNNAENEFFENNETKKMSTSHHSTDFTNFEDIEDLQHKYGGNIPLDDSIIPDELRRLRYKEIMKKRAIMVGALLAVLFCIYRLFF